MADLSPSVQPCLLHLTLIVSLPFPLDPTEHVQFWLGSPSTTAGWVREGDSVQLFCRGDGSPTPEYTFFRLQVPQPITGTARPDLCNILTCTYICIFGGGGHMCII